MVTLSNDEIKCITLFESVTGAVVEDCILDEGRVIFIVKEGEMGRAIGRGGETINRVRALFKKQIDVFEAAETMEGFVRHLFPGVELRELKVMGQEGDKTVQITVNPKDRGAAIGRNGDRIKLARTLLEKRHKVKLKLV